MLHVWILNTVWKTKISVLNYSIFHSVFFLASQSTQKCIWPKILWYNKHKYLKMVVFVFFWPERNVSLFWSLSFFQHTHTFCFLLFIEKGEHYWSMYVSVYVHILTHTCTCNVSPNGSIPSLYSIVFLRQSNFFSVCYHFDIFYALSNKCYRYSCGNCLKRHPNNRDTDQIKFVFFRSVSLRIHL